MTLYQIKPKFQALLRPLVKRLAARGVTANQVTLAAAGGSLVVGALVAALAWLPGVFLLMPLWLFVRMALNAIDGMLAREHGQQSVLGAYLNELGDIVSDIALILPFALVAPFGAGEIMVFALLAVIVECAGLIGPLAGASRRYDGPLGKSDRALVLGALGLWAGLGLSLAHAAHWLWVLLSLLSLLTIANRVRRGVAEGEQAHQARAQAAPHAKSSSQPVE
ncbi:CDP-alcohol phosphatidyltransferase family protein [Cupriavidus basilensis]|uniref:CDP-alcohol phosphatidyltransferase family protein n=1 Tax=Cupriavidus basilensis TaxID=68895 RepID=UPI0020A6375F|nr:CDP-alcohol phosphatidyltransferase family protein [Cupriavidus basilensis]MCP3020864.1 CDP-alcohol phosphatidyltransferase family protein [Cupriavidus basilensis]MDR3379010.1 CDP-alcohol phosphatidyltransferase family protein [Cupriavidus basilensis]